MQNIDVRVTEELGLTREKKHRVPVHLVQQLASSGPGLLA